MCRPVECPTCHKTTWAGCGQHIEAVKASVPPNQWCTCSPDAARPTRGSIFQRFTGR